MEKRTLESFDYNLGYSIRRSFKEGFNRGYFQAKVEEFERVVGKPGRISFECGDITLEKATREEVLAFVRIFGGRWNKTVSVYDESKLNYIQQLPHPAIQDDYITLKASECEPPPSCRIVEETVTVPAHTEVVKKVVCTPDKDPQIPIEEPEVATN